MLKPLAVLIGASTLALAASAAPNSNLDASSPPSAPQMQPAPAPAPASQPVPGPAYEQPTAPDAAADQSAPVQTASPAVVAATPAQPQHDWWLLIPIWLTAIFTGGILVFVARLYGAADRLLRQQRLP
ncbi:MAG TPA: hypothetical protein VN932_09160 [Rhizomicrobium sp.]|nr:hypothetical protein [Rhizomicrobium sp.]